MKSATPCIGVTANSNNVIRMAPAPSAGSAYPGSFRPCSPVGGSGLGCRVGDSRTAIGSAHLLPADDYVGAEVDYQCDHEQAQPGGDQRTSAHLPSLAILQGDVRGERHAAVLGDMPVDVVDRGEDQGDGECL